MRCPFCQADTDRVVDSRPHEDAGAIRRRRECLQCHKRFTTFERYDTLPLIVLKSDNRREPFDRQKLREGLVRACEKRPIPTVAIEQLVTELEHEFQEAFVMEIPSKEIGDRVLARLRKLDEVAYIRFASVFKQFEDAAEFHRALRRLRPRRSRPSRHAVAGEATHAALGARTPVAKEA